MNRYPDMGVTELTETLAARLDVPPERLAFGPGSVGVLGQIIAATCDAGDEVVFAWRSLGLPDSLDPGRGGAGAVIEELVGRQNGSLPTATSG